MPAKNTRQRSWIGPNHVYNRARNGRTVFRDDADRDAFLSILASRLSRSAYRSRKHRRCIDVIGAAVSSYCLMTTHFHLIIWQDTDGELRRLMNSVLSAYVRYYNDRHGTSGPLFDGPFRSNPILDAKQFRWTTGYIHDNHPSGTDYLYSSHIAFVDERVRPGWLAADRALAEFGTTDAYHRFMQQRATRADLNRVFF
jgi:hypothetical protein